MTQSFKSKAFDDIRQGRDNELKKKAARAGNEAFKVCWLNFFLNIAVLTIAAVVGALAFPEADVSLLGWVTLIPVYLIVRKRSIIVSAFYGYYWSYVYCVSLFFWLREIEGIVPFALSPLLASFYLPFFTFLPYLRNKILYPAKIQLDGHKRVAGYLPKSSSMVFYTVAAAALWCLCEWLRSWVLTGLPWNYLATTQWQNIPLIQIAEYTGIFGISFVVVFFNISAAESIEQIINITEGKQARRPVALILSVTLTLAVGVFGFLRVKKITR